MNPLVRLLAGVLAVLALVGAFFFGLFVLAVLVGVGIIAWLVLWLRMAWLRRKMRRGGRSAGSGRQGEDDVIDAEYTVVSRREEK
ncbi:MAG: hypothetical protein PVJ33_05760 [Lysobacterales bacterium]